MQRFQGFSFLQFVGKISDFSNADVAVDQYHRFLRLAVLFKSGIYAIYVMCQLFLWWFWTSVFQEDVQLMANMRMDAYRFSIAWSRILPSMWLQTRIAMLHRYSNGPLIYFSFFHLNMFTCRQLLLLYSFWPWIILVASDGTGQVNQAGIDHYNKVIDTIVSIS